MHDHGITEENVEDVTSRADLILDGVDVTTKPPLRHKVHLHRHAREKRKTVVSGYDIAGVQMLLIYEYGDRRGAARREGEAGRGRDSSSRSSSSPA